MHDIKMLILFEHAAFLFFQYFQTVVSNFSVYSVYSALSSISIDFRSTDFFLMSDIDLQDRGRSLNFYYMYIDARAMCSINW